ncbi:FAD dependent oxidoreductase (plasmid) [Rhizobium leguminosarum bv. trifolii WSM2304]|uniref:FAD dependent oxidoreductase n=1 Tax=Rhizobium leguminosarum bv. trifolii (strain WSM2304) TaxID=395492 RepID=A0ABF7QZD3_RHILW|nr:FAD-binding oxidoreductase [Rhizobium leguminosarum]ACI59663.1 FAD dependent oxidoreductase [Rhizobium leguminosarum bv. trifolii WSM2304]
MNSFDVIVVGSGLLGLSTAYNAQKAGARVAVVDRGPVAYEASSRATGYLSLRADDRDEAPLAEMAEKLWDTLDEELGYPTEWTQKGRLWVAFSDKQVGELREILKAFQRADFGFEMIDADACRKLIPILSNETRAGVYTPRSGHANPQRVSQAYAWAFQDFGGTILENTPVYSVIEEAGKVKGVRTANGDILADRVVLCAAGFNANLLRPFGVEFPVASVRLEALVTTPLPPMYEVGFIGLNGLSVRQTKRGNLHANGGPHEWVDVEADKEPAKPNTPIVRNLVRRMIEAFPVAAGTQLLRTWAGVLDITRDQKTIIHKFGNPEGLLVAAGAGHGFGMAPAVGIAMADLALKGRTDAPVDRLSLDRFGTLSPNWKVEKKWNAGSYNT